jgi:hypothetical protein
MSPCGANCKEYGDRSTSSCRTFPSCVRWTQSHRECGAYSARRRPCWPRNGLLTDTRPPCCDLTCRQGHGARSVALRMMQRQLVVMIVRLCEHGGALCRIHVSELEASPGTRCRVGGRRRQGVRTGIGASQAGAAHLGVGVRPGLRTMRVTVMRAAQTEAIGRLRFYEASRRATFLKRSTEDARPSLALVAGPS